MTNDRKLVRALITWYATNARDLPWRRTRDPYTIWISEVMLQQTQVKTVLPYFERWTKALPDVHALARARVRRLHKLWEGLGYYRRVRHLQAAARVILERHRGVFPEDYEQVLTLPGIGRYTAGAICSVAFNQPRPIVDGNVARVLSRVFGLEQSLSEPGMQARLWDVSERLVRTASTLPPPQKASGQPSPWLPCSNFNQAMMELGALVCNPRQPRCAVCPIARLCVAFKLDRVEQLPARVARPPALRREFAAFLVRRNGDTYLVRKRPQAAVNGGLWEFPNVETAAKSDDVLQAAEQCLGCRVRALSPVFSVKHTITRYRITLRIYQTEVAAPGPQLQPGWRWCTPRQLEGLPLPSAHKRVLTALSASGRSWRPEIRDSRGAPEQPLRLPRHAPSARV